MSDDGLAFDFTDAEVYSALRLAMSEDEAREKASAIMTAFRTASDWAASEDTLLLLSLGTESANGKVQRIRQFVRQSHFTTWSQDQLRSRPGGIAPEELRLEWDSLTAAEDREWVRLREELRQSLRDGLDSPAGA